MSVISESELKEFEKAIDKAKEVLANNNALRTLEITLPYGFYAFFGNKDFWAYWKVQHNPCYIYFVENAYTENQKTYSLNDDGSLNYDLDEILLDTKEKILNCFDDIPRSIFGAMPELPNVKERTE